MSCKQTITTDEDLLFLNYLDDCKPKRIYPPLRLYEQKSFIVVNGIDSRQISVRKDHFEVCLNGVDYDDEEEFIEAMLEQIELVNEAAAGAGGSVIIDGDNVGLAKESKQDAANALLTEIRDKTDKEITKCVGFDSAKLLPENVSGFGSDSLGLGGGTPPAFINTTSTSFDIQFANFNYQAYFNLGGAFGQVEFVNIFLRVEQAPINPSSQFLRFYLYETGTPAADYLFNPALAAFQTSSFTVGETQIVQLSFDNRALNINNLSVVVWGNWPTPPPANRRYSVTMLGTTFLNYNPSDQITEYVKWEDNIQSGVEYRDYLNNPYTLEGFFIKDVNKATEERLSTYLSAIQATNEVIASNTAKGDLKKLFDEADDLVETITWLDPGNPTDRRPDTIVYSSVVLALSVTKTFAYAGSAGDYYVTSITLS